jgi:hypothetical protein
LVAIKATSHTTTFLTESSGYLWLAWGWCASPRDGFTQSPESGSFVAQSGVEVHSSMTP